jgi:hypothetical protein
VLLVVERNLSNSLWLVYQYDSPGVLKAVASIVQAFELPVLGGKRFTNSSVEVTHPGGNFNKFESVIIMLVFGCVISTCFADGVGEAERTSQWEMGDGAYIG